MIRGAVQSRNLSEAQATAITQKLISIGKRFSVNLTQIGDREAGEYAQQKGYALSKGAINVEVEFSGAISPPQYGLIVIGKPQNPAFQAFMAANIVLKGIIGANEEPNIVVGLKPPSL